MTTTTEVDVVEQSDELDTFAPLSNIVELSDGTKVELQALKTRQFFKLLRIVTHSTSSLLGDFRLTDTESSEEFVGKLMGLILFAIPESEDETVDFLFSMLEPVGMHSGRKLTKEQEAENEALATHLVEVLYNPELEDLVTIIEAIVRREASDIQSLGKRLMGMFQIAAKTGQL